jgi:hypothetical protein
VYCAKCHSDAVAAIPAEVRLYRNQLRTLSHPPVNPSPEILVCTDCGWCEFSVPRAWISAGWLRAQTPVKPPAAATVAAALPVPIRKPGPIALPAVAIAT